MHEHHHNHDCTRFTLEEKILNCWSIIEDLELVKRVDDPVKYTQALKHVYAEKFEALWETFEKMIEHGRI